MRRKMGNVLPLTTTVVVVHTYISAYKMIQLSHIILFSRLKECESLSKLVLVAMAAAVYNECQWDGTHYGHIVHKLVFFFENLPKQLNCLVCTPNVQASNTITPVRFK